MRHRWLPALAVLLLAGTAAAQIAKGRPFPDFEATNTHTGERFKLSDYRGKVVFLDFWGDW